MQQSAVPELAHAQTSTMHWLATATAVAGVVALSSVLQPGPATAAQPTAADSKSAPANATAPDPAGIEFPLDCGTVKTKVAHKASGDLDGDGRPETIAAVHCDAPMGTPPDGLYVLTRGATSTEPRVVATLVDPEDRRTVTGLTVRDDAVQATLLGYSTPDVPSCCPDLEDAVKWQWRNGTFVRSAPAGTHTV